MIYCLDNIAEPRFPDTLEALVEPAGLLAVGGRLNVDWLLVAYRQGIFPWFSENEPILWWSPAPRTVLFPDKFLQSRSLLKLARQQRYHVSRNQNFETVIHACAESRAGQDGTWINSQMIDAYIEMHKAGFAHSIECYDQDELVGGLYGVSLGQVFFGESMFSRKPNASKLCLKYLVDSGHYNMIDCQLPTDHLHSLGASEIDRESFETCLDTWIWPTPTR